MVALLLIRFPIYRRDEEIPALLGRKGFEYRIGKFCKGRLPAANDDNKRGFARRAYAVELTVKARKGLDTSRDSQAFLYLRQQGVGGMCAIEKHGISRHHAYRRP